MVLALQPSFVGDYAMSDEDRAILEQIITQQHQATAPRLRPDKFFELFASEQFLRAITLIPILTK